MKDSFLILGFFLLGGVLGISGLLTAETLPHNLDVYALYLVIFFAGISIGGNTAAWKLCMKLKAKILLLPLIAIISAFAAGTITTFFFADISLAEGLAVSSGFGYYSLSTVLIRDLHSEQLAILGLLINIFREFATFLGTPFLIRYLHPLTAITVGGATCMDATLPLITRFAGKKYGLLAASSGAILTALVPIFVTLLLAQ